MRLFSLLCRQVDEQQQQTIEFEQRIRQTFKKEFNQTKRKARRKPQINKLVCDFTPKY